MHIKACKLINFWYAKQKGKSCNSLSICDKEIVILDISTKKLSSEE